MINRISKLREFGVFKEFTWPKELSNFKRFNLIYGWNRSGKTTLSRVFESCEKKLTFDEILFKQYPRRGAFEIEFDGTQKIKDTNIDTCVLPVKVFNQDFIEENISFDSSNSSNAIIYIGEDDIKSKEVLSKLIEENLVLQQTYEDSVKDKTSKEEVKKNFLISLGRELSNVIYDKTYNRNDAEEKITSLGASNFDKEILSDEDFLKFDELSKSKKGIEQKLFSELSFSISQGGDEIDNFDKLYNYSKSLLEKKVTSITIDRLKNDSNLNDWVQRGFELHKSKEETEKCLFCQKQLEKDFLASLANHFSKDYEKLQVSIQALIQDIGTISLQQIPENNDEYYPVLRDEYSKQAKILNGVVDQINSWLTLVISKLNEKDEEPLSIVTGLTEQDGLKEKYNKCIEDINILIGEQNLKVINHLQEVSDAKNKIEHHTIGVALKDINYDKYVLDIEKARDLAETVEKKLQLNKEQIKKLERENSNIGKAIDDINNYLKDFFGGEEILLQLDEAKKGYKIFRAEKLAENLSEGEKTAIAFSYFIVKVKEKGFDIKNAIIFIDDPISSLDSNFTYQAFTLIKNSFKEVGQLFISTHNFQFFNLVKDWFTRKNQNIEEENIIRKLNNKDIKEMPCEFFMIVCKNVGDHREAKIVELEKTLKDHKSEYSFLFSLLHYFSTSTEEPTFEQIYNISNIGRRFLDIYSDFKIPSSSYEQQQKMEILVREINKTKDENSKISDASRDKVIWLLNGFSHNSDPTSIIEHKDKAESKEAIRVLLNVIKDSDPQHFMYLEKNLQQS